MPSDADPRVSPAADNSPVFKIITTIASVVSATAIVGMVSMYGKINTLEERVTHRGLAIQANVRSIGAIVDDLKARTDDRYRRRDAERDQGEIWDVVRVHENRLDELDRLCEPAKDRSPRRPTVGTPSDY